MSTDERSFIAQEYRSPTPQFIEILLSSLLPYFNLQVDQPQHHQLPLQQELLLLLLLHEVRPHVDGEHLARQPKQSSVESEESHPSWPWGTGTPPPGARCATGEALPSPSPIGHSSAATDTTLQPTRSSASFKTQNRGSTAVGAEKRRVLSLLGDHEEHAQCGALEEEAARAQVVAACSSNCRH